MYGAWVSNRYAYELASRLLVWLVCGSIALAGILIIRVIYHKVVYPKCCRGKLTHRVQHNWEHTQNHLVADGFANGVGCVSFVWSSAVVSLFLTKTE